MERLSQSQIHEIFNDSYQRCQDSGNFLDVFYEGLWSENTTFRQLFEDVDMERQKKMLHASFLCIMMATFSNEAQSHIEQLGDRHGKNGLGLTTKDMDIWFECLLASVSKCDPKYTPQIEHAWRQCFTFGLSLMKERCS